MKRMFTLLAAFLVMFSMVGVGGTASAAPSTDPILSARLSVDKNCLATVYVSWAKVPENLVGATVEISLNATQEGPYIQAEHVALDATKGKAVATFQGVHRADGKQQLVGGIFIAGWTAYSTKAAACKFFPSPIS